MNLDSQLQWQAYLDGELPPAERKALEQRLERDGEARRLLVGLQAANEALGLFESDLKVPEPRAFYWSGIARRIRVEEAQASVPALSAAGWLESLRRLLVPAGWAAAFLIAAFLATTQFRHDGAAVSRLEASLATAGTFTYRDFASGTTLVWVSYPAEKEFADLGAASTLPSQ